MPMRLKWKTRHNYNNWVPRQVAFKLLFFYKVRKIVDVVRTGNPHVYTTISRYNIFSCIYYFTAYYNILYYESIIIYTAWYRQRNYEQAGILDTCQMSVLIIIIMVSTAIAIHSVGVCAQRQHTQPARTTTSDWQIASCLFWPTTDTTIYYCYVSADSLVREIVERNRKKRKKVISLGSVTVSALPLSLSFSLCVSVSSPDSRRPSLTRATKTIYRGEQIARSRPQTGSVSSLSNTIGIYKWDKIFLRFVRIMLRDTHAS